MGRAFNIIEALKLIQEGQKVREISWNDDCYIYYNESEGLILMHYGNEGEDEWSGTTVDAWSTQAQYWEVYEEPILTKEEKKYLESVLAPYKDRVHSIVKWGYSYLNHEYIKIFISGNSELEDCVVALPVFKKGNEYKSMKVLHHYSMDELKLFR